MVWSYISLHCGITKKLERRRVTPENEKKNMRKNHHLLDFSTALTALGISRSALSIMPSKMLAIKSPPLGGVPAVAPIIPWASLSSPDETGKFKIKSFGLLISPTGNPRSWKALSSDPSGSMPPILLEEATQNLVVRFEATSTSSSRTPGPRARLEPAVPDSAGFYRGACKSLALDLVLLLNGLPSSFSPSISGFDPEVRAAVPPVSRRSGDLVFFDT